MPIQLKLIPMILLIFLCIKNSAFYENFLDSYNDDRNINLKKSRDTQIIFLKKE